MNQLLNKTLSQIVTENHQAAHIFEKYGLDFCCKGKRPLQEACAEKEIKVDVILNDLNYALAKKSEAPDFNSMSLTELSEYIVRVHHSYLHIHFPQISNYTFRVASKHGDRWSYMKEVFALFQELRKEMEDHMEKEEKVLFRFIKKMELFESADKHIELLETPISVMEHEHATAGFMMQKIRELTNNYTAPAQACTTFRLTLESLKALEEDLHQHVHLENNILFPKAIKLYRKLAHQIKPEPGN